VKTNHVRTVENPIILMLTTIVKREISDYNKEASAILIIQKPTLSGRKLFL